MADKLWDFVQNRLEHQYENCVIFACVLRDVVTLHDPARGERVADAIRRAQYEEAINIAIGVELA